MSCAPVAVARSRDERFQRRRQLAPDPQRRPLVTFALFAFKHAHCIERALQGALAQTYSPLEIVLSDDGSDDATYALMEKAATAYRGPHRVVLNRNVRTPGIGEHVNTVARMARGDLIVFAAGDDVSLPQRVETIVEQWLVRGQPEAVICSDFLPVDRAGRPIDRVGAASRPGSFRLERMVRGDIGVKGATAAATKNLFKSFPPISSSVHCEDRVLPFRALLLGGQVIFIAQKLVKYCTEGGISERKAKGGGRYLLRHAPRRLAFMLPDAVQRLTDLKAISPQRKTLIKGCETTIRTQEAGIDLPKRRGIELEAHTLLWVSRGAAATVLLKLYFKLRFIRLIMIYRRIRRYGQ